ncbi:hypothetical protein D3C76_1637780 [compost metagenome]
MAGFFCIAAACGYNLERDSGITFVPVHIFLKYINALKSGVSKDRVKDYKGGYGRDNDVDADFSSGWSCTCRGREFAAKRRV